MNNILISNPFLCPPPPPQQSGEAGTHQGLNINEFQNYTSQQFEKAWTQSEAGVEEERSIFLSSLLSANFEEDMDSQLSQHSEACLNLIDFEPIEQFTSQELMADVSFENMNFDFEILGYNGEEETDFNKMDCAPPPPPPSNNMQEEGNTSINQQNMNLAEIIFDHHSLEQQQSIIKQEPEEKSPSPVISEQFQSPTTTPVPGPSNRADKKEEEAIATRVSGRKRKASIILREALATSPGPYSPSPPSPASVKSTKMSKKNNFKNEEERPIRLKKYMLDSDDPSVRNAKQARANREKKKAELEYYKKKCIKQDRELKIADNSIEELTAENEFLSTNVSEYEDKVANLEDKINTLELNCEEKEKEVARLKQTITNLSTQHTRITRQMLAATANNTNNVVQHNNTPVIASPSPLPPVFNHDDSFSTFNIGPFQSCLGSFDDLDLDNLDFYPCTPRKIPSKVLTSDNRNLNKKGYFFNDNVGFLPED